MAESVKNHKTIILTIYLQMQGVMTKTMPILTFLWHFNNGNRIFFVSLPSSSNIYSTPS